MTREEVKELLPIVKAFAEGKTIQLFGRDGWTDLYNDFIFDISYRYRIKPETKCRPFNDAEECWQEMQKHQPFGWVKDKEDGAYVMVTKVSDGRDDMAINGNYNWRLDGLLEHFTFADGTPFGIREE